MSTFSWVSKLTDDEVCRLYARWRSPTSMMAWEVYKAWLALPEDERAESTARMRAELERLAPGFEVEP